MDLFFCFYVRGLSSQRASALVERSRLPHPPFSCFVSMRISKGDNPEVVGSPWSVIEGPGGGPEEVSKGAVGGAVKINTATFELEISFSLRTSETQIDIDVSRCRKIVHK